MVHVLSAYRTRSRLGAFTPQFEPIPGTTDQVKNNAGGYVYKIDDMQALDRFLILGTTGGTFYVSEKKLTIDNATKVRALIEKNGVAVVNRVLEISKAGRAPKNDPALFTLAMALSFGNQATKREVVRVLPRVARIGTHLFLFVSFCEQFRGWGRVMRDAVSNWYLVHENPE